MKTAAQLATLEVIAFDTGKRHDELQAEFDRRAALSHGDNTASYAKRYVAYLEWLHKQFMAPKPAFNVWAADILGMPVFTYLNH